MTTPNRPTLTEHELDAALHAWMEPGVRSLSEPALERVLATVHATRQVPAWRVQGGLGRAVRTTRFAAVAAVVVLVAVAAFALGAQSVGRPAGIGSISPSSVPSPLAASPSPSPTPRPIPTITGHTLSGVVAATGATYEVRYPLVAGLADPTIAAAINTLLRSDADATVRDFTTGIGKDPQAGPGQPSTVQADFTIAFSSPDLLSLRSDTYSYPSGAAHGGSVVTTCTFDLASGKRLALADLFRPGAAYLDALAREARTQLGASLASWIIDPSMADWLTSGSAPTADNYAAWAITPGGVEITFGQYQVAPYAAGMPVVTIPLAHLAGLIDPSGPLTSLTAVPLPSVTVSLGIYSGRPDPAWALSDVQVAALLGQIESLPATNGTPPAGGLGYHGFSILVTRSGEADQVFVAFRGAVHGPGDAPGTYRSDPQRSVESALLDTGRSHLTAGEVSIVEADLAQ